MSITPTAPPIFQCSLQVSYSCKLKQVLAMALERENSESILSAVSDIIHDIKHNSNKNVYQWQDFTNWAIKNNRMEALKPIIQCDEMEQGLVDQIFSYSAMNNHQEILHSILNSSNFCKISDDNLCGSFQCIVEKGYSEIVKAILDKASHLNINLEYKVIQNIMSYSLSEKSMLDILGKIFRWALENSNKNFIQNIMVSNSFKCSQGNPKTFTKLLQKEYKNNILDFIVSHEINQEVRDVLVDTALSAGFTEIVEVLIG